MSAAPSPAARPAQAAPARTTPTDRQAARERVLSVDVTGVVVPATFTEWTWEYLAGYRVGRAGSRQWNPVSHRSPAGEFRRKAWAAGREAGKQARLAADVVERHHPGPQRPDVVVPVAHRDRASDFVLGYTQAFDGIRRGGPRPPVAGTLRRQAYDAGRRAGAKARAAIRAEIERAKGARFAITPKGKAQLLGTASSAPSAGGADA